MKKILTDINNNIFLKEGNISYSKNNNKNVILIDNKKIISTFKGFGSAITESSAYNYSKLSIDNKKKFLDDYYSKDGLNYQFGRISIGSNDFSLKSFQYAKKRDLRDFNINRDLEYVIPFLKNIIGKKKISLIASPWSPPRMYKRLPILRWGIKLTRKYYENYSNYLLKFLEEYQKFGINIDYITMQNEPLARQRWESCTYNIDEQKWFIYNYLLPKLNKTKLLLWDHNKDDLYNIVNSLYSDNEKIAGTCFHYYTGHCFDEIKKIREKYPNMFLVNSEMCCSYSKYNEKAWIGAAEYYLKDIIGDINSGVNAYLDWNILLDENGGPTHSKNYVKSASILVNDNYIKSPIYYYLYHISHFLGNKNIVLYNNCFTNKLHVVSIKCDKNIVIVIMNSSNTVINYSLNINDKIVFDTINSHSVITYVENID